MSFASYKSRMVSVYLWATKTKFSHPVWSFDSARTSAITVYHNTLQSIQLMFDNCVCLYIAASCSATKTWPKEKFVCQGHSGSWSEDKADYDINWQPLFNYTGVVPSWSYDTNSAR